MEDPKIEPHRITKPIQLLAAWLAGLAVVDTILLTAAKSITTPAWIPSLLAIAAVANVPLFVIGIFILQTKYRPEMQEDAYYWRYLERQHPSSPGAGARAGAPATKSPADIEKDLREVAARIASEAKTTSAGAEQGIFAILREQEVRRLADRFYNSRALSELHLHLSAWPEVAKAYAANGEFEEDVSALVSSGLASFKDRDITAASLTPIGQDVAEQLESRKLLWNQRYGRNLPGSAAQP